MIDCTLVTACFDTSRFNNNPITIEDGLNRFDVILKLPVYLVIYTDDTYYTLINERRILYGFESITHIIINTLNELWSFKYLDKVKDNRIKYFPTRDERTSAESHCVICNKFDFVLQIIDQNPFNTTKFAWIDAFLGINGKMRIFEDYTQEKFLSILTNITDKFHIQVLNVNDKKFKLNQHKREYYQTYRYVVCGGLFTCSKQIGVKILSRLKENFIHTTELGYGHGEEMLYLEILDEFYTDINKSYGDYGQMGNNFICVSRNLDYIYYNIIKRYLDFGYNRECYNCCKKVLYGIEYGNAKVSADIYMKILFSYYVSSYYYKQKHTLSIVAHIYDICNINDGVKQAFKQYESQFLHAGYLKKKYKLVICIFACATIKKYKDEILKINETWGQRAEEKGVKVLFFLGEELTDLTGDKYIYLKGIKNDYNSAADKQNLGLKYIYENYITDFVFVCGTDTYPNIDKLLSYLDIFADNKHLYIGGHGDYRQIGNEEIYFHSGGAGFLLSNKLLQFLYPLLWNLKERWEEICDQNNTPYLKVACDVTIAYYVKQFHIIKNSAFISCNHKGYCYDNTYSCCVGKLKINEIISCHNMTLTDFDEYTKLLEDNNYYC